VANLEYVARKLYGALSFICEAYGTILDIYGRFSNVVYDFVVEVVSPLRPETDVDVEDICFFTVSKFKTGKKISVKVVNITHDFLNISKDISDVVYSTILFPDRVKALDDAGEKAKKAILSLARKHGLGGVIGKGLDYKYYKVFDSWFLLTDKGRNEIKDIMRSYGRIGCDFVRLTFERRAEGTVTKLPSVDYDNGEYRLLAFDSRELNHLVSAADWFVKQLIVIAENVE